MHFPLLLASCHFVLVGGMFAGLKMHPPPPLFGFLPFCSGWRHVCWVKKCISPLLLASCHFVLVGGMFAGLKNAFPPLIGFLPFCSGWMFAGLKNAFPPLIGFLPFCSGWRHVCWVKKCISPSYWLPAILFWFEACLISTSLHIRKPAFEVLTPIYIKRHSSVLTLATTTTIASSYGLIYMYIHRRFPNIYLCR